MTLALTGLIVLGVFLALSKTRAPAAAAEAPVLLLVVGAGVSFLYRASGLPGAPAEWVAAASEAGLAALVFACAAQVRASRFARRCPASFRLTVGGAPLFLVLCALSAFVLLPELSLPSALLVGAILALNGAAFDRRAVTGAPAPAAVKAAVRNESAASIAFGAPVAVLIAGYATAPGAGQIPLEPLLEASLGALGGFALGGAAGLLAARLLERVNGAGGERSAVVAGFAAFFAAALFGANAVIAAGAAGLVWSEETAASGPARLRLRRRVERFVPPAAYLLFGFTLAPRVFEADLLSLLFAVAAVTALRVGPRLAMLQSAPLPKESQVFLAWFGGAPGAASALFAMSLLDDALILDHEAALTVVALAVVAGVIAARASSRPLANAFLRETAAAKKRRLFAS
ncbi:cation:proton antiporter domain-containing protein [Amphiplicatus metriothermophilus]|uniref:Sodium/proton antiporter, CPA1 family n=1 Tax=Amphiplicatus metriothermophilus TaxID=1519374 RepID=A0A239PV61_9PROT|nr:cation:proton antiporter [Amphiplicatus metriothermophilus]MBB5519625.1 NhaP-type Na+/H+ or K+/H+ antiporter [Amphiplicatus metriothermophilus]SNT74189.1 sodium/proton antiporter, CPA1 family [Amphiplicatus metriothermophilus]